MADVILQSRDVYFVGHSDWKDVSREIFDEDAASPDCFGVRILYTRRQPHPEEIRRAALEEAAQACDARHSYAALTRDNAKTPYGQSMHAAFADEAGRCARAIRALITHQEPDAT